MNKFKTAFNLSSILCLLLLLATSAVAGDFSVVPGKSVGKIRLGTSRTAVTKLMGKPNTTLRQRGGLIQDSWLGPKLSKTAETRSSINVMYLRNKAIQIEFSSPRFATSKGVSTRTDLAQLHRNFKNLRQSLYEYDDYVRYYYDQVQLGIAFQRGTNGMFWNMKEGSSVTPESIIVHRSGFRVIPEFGGKPTKEPNL